MRTENAAGKAVFLRSLFAAIPRENSVERVSVL